MSRLPVAGPWITQREIDYVADAAENDWYEGAGKYTGRFERAFADYLGCRYAVSLPHCTSALHLALVAYGVGPGDEVVVPELTWIASVAPVSYVGATPCFADVDPVTWCLSAESLERSITPRTKAFIAVDLYGSVCDMDALRAVTTRRGIRFIEDAAEAVGSRYRGRLAGSFGDAGAFSFHGSKMLTTGEGGMLTTDDEALFQRVHVLRDHGRSPGDRYFQNTEIAYKYKMSGLQAALGLAQLERVEELIRKKRAMYSWYRERLAGMEGVTLNAEPPDTLNNYWMITAVLDPELGIDSFELMRRFDEHQIDSRPFFRPLSSLPAFQGQTCAENAQARNPVSYRIGPYGINLPSALRLEEADVERVCDVFRAAVAAGPAPA